MADKASEKVGAVEKDRKKKRWDVDTDSRFHFCLGGSGEVESWRISREERK